MFVVDSPLRLGYNENDIDYYKEGGLVKVVEVYVIMAYIYVINDQDGGPFYVGKTVDPKKRMAKHLSYAKSGAPFYVCNKIRKLIREGFTPDIEVIEEVDDEQVDEREIHHIARLKAEGVKLCNLTLGGEGGCISESAKKGVETKRRNGTLNPSEETKRKISEARKGKPLSKEHKQALSRAWKRTPEQLKISSQKAAKTSKGKINIKRYVCISPSGEEFITENGMTYFCEEHGLTAGNMFAVVRGKRKHHKGWTARRLENGDQERMSDDGAPKS